MKRQALISATFESRPNRFLVQARLGNGHTVLAHLADPGRLRELLLPGAALRLRRAPQGSSRRTRYSVLLVRSTAPRRPWVSLDTSLANSLAEDLLSNGRVHGVGAGWQVRREVRHGRSRFDFLLSRNDGEKIFVEVKSVTLVVNGRGLFPDAPTARGARHVRELEGIARTGGRAAVLFIAQRQDTRSVAPHRILDPAFTEALLAAARGGVLLRAARFCLSEDGAATWEGSVPVRLPGGARRRTSTAADPG